MQCFMLTSILSDNRDVISIVPVLQMNAEYLCDLLKKVIINVSTVGYRIIVVIGDNEVNRNSFKKLAASDSLVQFIYNPVHCEQNFFFV